MTEPASVAAIVLAAGQSSRMGQANKLRCELGGKPVIAQVLDQLQQSTLGEIIIITGHQRKQIEQQLHGPNQHAVFNPDFENGMSTSIRAGMAALPETVQAAVICQGDMPFVSANVINQLINAHIENPAKVIAPAFMGKRGNPLLWPRRLFPVLESLEGDCGARQVLKKFNDEILKLDVDNIGILLDIDSPEALQYFKDLLE